MNDEAVDRVTPGEEHNHPDCPGDDYTACHDGWIYEPCGSEFCYGADTAAGVCTCTCHDRDLDPS